MDTNAERGRALSPTLRLVRGDSYFCYVSVKCKSKRLTEGCPAAKAVFSAAAAPCLWGGTRGLFSSVREGAGPGTEDLVLLQVKCPAWSPHFTASAGLTREVGVIPRSHGDSVTHIVLGLRAPKK